MNKFPKIIENLSNDRLLEIQNKLLKTRALLKISTVSKAVMARKSYYSGLNYLLSENKHRRTLYATTDRRQCYPDRNRSQGDLYMMMRYYYPNITFVEFRKELFRLLNHWKVNTFYCNTIHKRIFFKDDLGLRRQSSPYLESLSEIDELGDIIHFSDGITRNDFYDGDYYYDYNDYESDSNDNEDWREDWR